MSTPEELTPEQKKEKARLAREAAAASAKAEKDQVKENEKTAANATKVAEATQKVTELFTTVKTETEAGNSVLSLLTAESQVSEIVAASDQAKVHLASANTALKSLKQTVKKLKEPGDLQASIAPAEAFVETLKAGIEKLKEAVAASKKATKDAEKAEAKAKKDAEKAASAMPNQNGITRPREGTACGNAWALMDELTSKLKQPVPISILLQASETRGLNYDTVKTQYARWKKFNGIEGRVAVPLPAGLLD